ncbi:MAG: hypothetical protein KAI69_00095 [Deltaproteobacteria bacterium]|nr:hypothetical protein [Deltaproteobacteria bacterium]MCK5679218.1 hypothetical protein [bacterium]
MPINTDQVNDLIHQATKNLDQMFGLFTTIQKQVNTLSNLVIDETADTTKTLSKGFVAAGDKVSGEVLRVAQEGIDDSVKVAFPKDGKE